VNELVKKIAVYGTYQAKVPVHQRYWKWIYHRTGREAGQKWYKRRVWKKTKRLKKAVLKGRYEFHGRGRDLYQAVIKAHSIVPKGYVDVPAQRFLRNPEQFGYEGTWIEKDVES
jgi:hypothetical protein